MLLLPAERTLSPAAIGLRLISRDAALRAGKPYAIVGAAPPGPASGASPLPWWAWVALGGVIVGVVYLTIRRQGGRDVPTYVLVDRDQVDRDQILPAAEPEPARDQGELAPVPLHPFSPDADLAIAFDRDVEAVWAGRDIWANADK